jgi:hypothetical protein
LGAEGWPAASACEDSAVFTVEQRERARARVLELAGSDDRVVAAAEIGALAGDAADRWSDVDLTFAIRDDEPALEVLDDWTRELASVLDAVRLFDLPAQSTIYRVFLLPGCLQVDLSVTPAADFRPRGVPFRLLAGRAGEPDPPAPPDAEHLVGLAVHHAVRGRICVERGRLWQAEYWISGVRDHALTLACLRRGLRTAHGRGFDDLSPDVLAELEGAVVRTLGREELLRALAVAAAAVAREAGTARLGPALEERLAELTH